MSNNQEITIKLDLLKEIRSKMYGQCIGDIGFTAVFTEHRLRDMKEEMEKQLKPCESCERNNKPHCGNDWCYTRKKDEPKRKLKCGDCGACKKSCGK